MEDSDMKDGYPPRPIPLLIKNDSGWTIPEEAKAVLHAIDNPISVIAVVGKYRTGKSYLMNRLIGRKTGFSIGSATQSRRKGIWMWSAHHPEDTNQCLILLDTIGLYDAEKEDDDSDLQLNTLSMLMSHCFMYSIKEAIDDTFIKELHQLAEMSNRIKSKQKRREYGNVAEELKSSCPELIVVDFGEQARDYGKQITPNEFLENALKAKNDSSKKGLNMNVWKERIRENFPHRKCIAFPKPVAEDDTINFTPTELQLWEINKSEICTELVNWVLTTTSSVEIDSKIVNGSGFLSAVERYTEAINEIGIEAAYDFPPQKVQRALHSLQETYCQALDEEYTEIETLYDQLEEEMRTCLEHEKVRRKDMMEVIQTKFIEANSEEDIDIKTLYKQLKEEIRKRLEEERVRRKDMLEALQKKLKESYEEQEKGIMDSIKSYVEKFKTEETRWIGQHAATEDEQRRERMAAIKDESAESDWNLLDDMAELAQNIRSPLHDICDEIVSLKNWPKAVEGIYVEEEKIVIDVLEGKVGEIKKFLDMYCQSSFQNHGYNNPSDIIKIMEQSEPLEFSQSTVSRGSGIGKSTQLPIATPTKSHIADIPGQHYGTLGCIAVEKGTGEYYFVTARHNFFPSRDAIRSPFSDDAKGLEGIYICDTETGVRHVSKVSYGVIGVFGPQNKGVDISVVHVKREPSQDSASAKEPEIYNPTDFALGKKVSRMGANNPGMRQKGIIKVIKYDSNITIGQDGQSEFWTDCIIVIADPTERASTFSTRGDSGSLVVAESDRKFRLLGLISHTRDWKDSDGTKHNAAVLVKLGNCFEAIKEKFNIDLEVNEAWERCEILPVDGN